MTGQASEEGHQTMNLVSESWSYPSYGTRFSRVLGRDLSPGFSGLYNGTVSDDSELGAARPPDLFRDLSGPVDESGSGIRPLYS